LHLEDKGIKSVETAVKAIVREKKKNLIQTPATKKIKITLPAGQTTMTTWAKGNPENSLTGFGRYWLRRIEKAVHFGWEIIIGKDK